MKFALITEGASEHRIVKHIINKCFKAYEPDINQIQPKIINDTQRTVGGWNEVLKYCKRDEDLIGIFVENDYLIIQIDTDQSQEEPFSVNHSKQNNIEKTVEELYTDVVHRLKSLINHEILNKYANKIFFAICIHTIECWLLPIFSSHHKAATKNCIVKFNEELRKRSIHIISSDGKNKANSIKTYETVLKNWKNKSDIRDAAKNNFAFQKFVDSITGINS